MPNPLMTALAEFEVSEANLVKLERLWTELRAMLPDGPSFGDDPEFEDRERAFAAVLQALPTISGWKPDIALPTPNEVGQWRLHAMEEGEPWTAAAVEESVNAPGKEIREYRARFAQKRRELIRDALIAAMDAIDADIQAMRPLVVDLPKYESAPDKAWEGLRAKVKQIEVLLGSSVQHPPTWTNLRRHLHFACVGDFQDIEKFDWPPAREALRKGLYGANEPLPQGVADLGQLVATKPMGSVATELKWEGLDGAGFERLIFGLFTGESNYENAEWSMKTNAPDRGRDLSVIRITRNGLADVLRQRIIVQCKHWRSRSLSAPDVAAAVAQADLWEAVDGLIIATSGRFSLDAVQWIEKHNESRKAPRIEMWPDSRLELLLAERPWLIAEFGLR